MANKLKLYAVAIMASRQIGDKLETTATPIALAASSEDEATGKALRLSERRWPHSNGWRQHTAGALEVDKDLIRSVS